MSQVSSNTTCSSPTVGNYAELYDAVDQGNLPSTWNNETYPKVCSHSLYDVSEESPDKDGRKTYLLWFKTLPTETPGTQVQIFTEPVSKLLERFSGVLGLGLSRWKTSEAFPDMDARSDDHEWSIHSENCLYFEPLRNATHKQFQWRGQRPDFEKYWYLIPCILTGPGESNKVKHRRKAVKTEKDEAIDSHAYIIDERGARSEIADTMCINDEPRGRSYLRDPGFERLNPEEFRQSLRNPPRSLTVTVFEGGMSMEEIGYYLSKYRVKPDGKSTSKNVSSIQD